jgi:hypothetical protein
VLKIMDEEMLPSISLLRLLISYIVSSMRMCFRGGGFNSSCCVMLRVLFSNVFPFHDEVLYFDLPLLATENLLIFCTGLYR